MTCGQTSSYVLGGQAVQGIDSSIELGEVKTVEVAVVVPGGLLRLVSLGRLVVWAKVIKLFFSVSN